MRKNAWILDKAGTARRVIDIVDGSRKRLPQHVFLGWQEWEQRRHGILLIHLVLV